ncbi:MULTISPECIES: hypothetical protein [Listeria]|uniref:Uncharacterized protein n=1 Tax=Listeria riparia FSL S10-1204 TaxID=1265816 RepID=W7D4Z5_9LIST|nr:MULTISPECIES: hypothetical protein [Listeria]EUJ42916.1 hypothetical protein PRIP_14722 [Listeria riparia FSL S10-1204]MBC2164657.1 hypothetical protein [Listeria booriae]
MAIPSLGLLTEVSKPILTVINTKEEKVSLQMKDASDEVWQTLEAMERLGEPVFIPYNRHTNEVDWSEVSAFGQ